MRASVWLLVGLLACGVACSGTRRVESGSGGMAGVGGTWVQYGSFGGKLAFVIWSDIAEKDGRLGGQGGGSSAGPSGIRASYHGKRVARDGREVEWEAATEDGRSGTVTINGTEFKLEGGPVFLVTTRGERAGVRQVQADLSPLQPAPESWERLAKEHAEVKEYLARVSGAE